jgi:hypothetical protein
VEEMRLLMSVIRLHQQNKSYIEAGNRVNGLRSDRVYTGLERHRRCANAGNLGSLEAREAARNSPRREPSCRPTIVSTTLVSTTLVRNLLILLVVRQGPCRGLFRVLRWRSNERLYGHQASFRGFD